MSRAHQGRERGRVHPRLRRAVFERDDYQCSECGSRRRIECDHVVPVHLGGQTAMDNLQTLCRDCHIAKTRRENGACEGAVEWGSFVARKRYARAR